MIYLLFVLLGVSFAGIFNDYISFGILALAIMLFVYKVYKTYSLKKIFICFLLFGIGFSYYTIIDTVTSDKYLGINTKNEYLNIKVLSEPEYVDGCVKFTGKLDKYNKKAMVTLRDTPYISYYDTVSLNGYVHSIETNKEIYYSNNIYYKVVSYDNNIKITEGKGFLKAVNDFKNKVIYILNNNFSFEASMFLKGVLIGDDSLRTEEFNESLKKLSLSHIVSVSGMHFSIITMMLLFVFRRLRIGRKISSLLTIPFAVIIACFIGFTPSVVRVLIMTTILAFADLFDRERVTDIYLLSLTAVIMLTFNVYYIHNIAFILSFLSLAGILVYNKTILRKFKLIPKKIGEVISVSISANIFTLPFVIYYFKGLPILSVIGNIVIVPLISYIMIYGIAVVFISLIFMELGKYIAFPLDLLVSLCVRFINFTGGISVSYIKTLAIESYFIVLYYLGIYVLYCKSNRLFKHLLASIIALYFILNLFLPFDRMILPYAEMYVMCGKNSGKGIVTYKDKTIFVNASQSNGAFEYKLIREECNDYFDIYVAFDSESVAYIDKYKINVGEVFVPQEYIYDKDYYMILSKYCKTITPVIDVKDILIYDFNLTLKAENGYNILEAKLKHKDKNIIFTKDDIDDFDYGSKYILPYYLMDKYDGYSFLLNCSKDEVERIKI